MHCILPVQVILSQRSARSMRRSIAPSRGQQQAYGPSAESHFIVALSLSHPLAWFLPQRRSSRSLARSGSALQGPNEHCHDDSWIVLHGDERVAKATPIRGSRVNRHFRKTKSSILQEGRLTARSFYRSTTSILGRIRSGLSALCTLDHVIA